MTQPSEAAQAEAEICPADPEGQHCQCWWDGDACCRCEDPPDPNVDPETGENTS